jgi:hypothetical protein
MIANRLCSPSRDGQELLPHLVDKLITASIRRETIRIQRFPHDDQIYLHGPDGVLAIDDSVNHSSVPSGLSLWEMGTSVDPKSKADDDFSHAEEKLASAFPGVTPPVTPNMASFVFVTSKPWESAEWVKGKRGCSTWKHIQVIDAVALEKWIEQCPEVMLWFANVCGLPAEGLFDAEQYIRKFGIGFGVSTISPELIVAGRVDDLARVGDVVFRGTGEAHVRGESIEEAAAFLAAASLLDSRTNVNNIPIVFADSHANLPVLATFGAELTLVPVDTEALTRAKGLPGQQWRIVTLGAEAAGSNGPKESGLTLGRCKRVAVEQHLVEKMKVDEHKARQIARDTKGSLIALLWLVGSGPLGVPRWASRKDATTHASMMLAGSWLGSNENDTKIIERLSKKDYRDIETLLQSAEVPEGPWVHQGVEWLCVSRDFGFIREMRR